MTGILQPLDFKFPIVDQYGRPTDYFTRWAQQRQIDIGDSITLTDLIDYLAAHKLIAGTGIQLTPDGNIANGVNIHADAQAILDEITSTRGALLYRGLLGWSALMPGTAGLFLQTAGPGADPLWAAAAGGGGGQSFEGFGNLLSLAGLTKLAGASANITLTDGTKANLYAWTASAANTIQMAYTAAPATPWDVYLRFKAQEQYGVNTDFGFAIRNSTTGKITIFQLFFNGNRGITVQEWTNATTFSASQYVSPNLDSTAPTWLRINNDGTNLNFYYSTNGLDWYLMLTRTLAAFMGSVDQVGLGGVPQVAGRAWVSNFGFSVPTVSGGGGTVSPTLAMPNDYAALQTPGVNYNLSRLVYVDQNFNINKIAFACQSANPACVYRPFVYACGAGVFSPTTLLGAGPQVTGTVAGYNEAPLSAPVAVTKGSYIFLGVSQITSGMTNLCSLGSGLVAFSPNGGSTTPLNPFPGPITTSTAYTQIYPFWGVG